MLHSVNGCVEFHVADGFKHILWLSYMQYPTWQKLPVYIPCGNRKR